MKLYYTIILVLLNNIVSAQIKPMSLQQCIDYAKVNHNSLKSAQIDEEITKAKNEQIFSSVYPQVGLSGGVNALPIVPQSRVSSDAFNFTGQPSPNKYTNLKFGLPYNMNCTLTVSQIIYNSSVLIALEARKTLEDLSVLNTKRTTEKLVVDISKAYYNCVIAQKRIRSLDENIKLIESFENNVKALYKEGFAEKIDADKLTVQRNNLTTEKQKIENLVDLSFQLLKFQMGMSLQEEISLTDDINSNIVKENLYLIDEPEYENRIELQLLQTAKKLNGYDYTRYLKSTHPTVVAFGSLGAGTSTSSFTDLFKYTWLPSSVIGINASMGLFDGGARKSKLQEIKLNIRKNEADIESFKDAVDFQTEAAKKTLNNNLKNLQSQEDNIALAQRVYDVAQKKFKEGVGANIEVMQAQTALKDAQTNYLSALYDVTIAKIDLLQALGKLK